MTREEAIQTIQEMCKRYIFMLCEDCKYRYMDGEVTHYYWCRLHDRPVDDTDYCSWGEESEVE